MTQYDVVGARPSSTSVWASAGPFEVTVGSSPATTGSSLARIGSWSSRYALTAVGRSVTTSTVTFVLERFLAKLALTMQPSSQVVVPGAGARSSEPGSIVVTRRRAR